LRCVIGAVAAIACTAGCTVVRVSGQPQGHFDTTIDYKTCDGTDYTATWIGNNFHHVERYGPDVHNDRIMRYLTWDRTCWQASWDRRTGQFLHVPLPYPGRGRYTHEDVILNYITWDGSKWSARRDGNGFYHTFVDFW
jgi:hypothetical protein